MDDAVTAYHAGDFAAAQIASERLAATSSGSTQTRATYLAGMSAYRLGRNSAAQNHLSQVADSSDAEVAGNASATLGLIAAEQNRHDIAVRYLTAAAAKLTGDDLARAYYYLAVSEQKLGRDSNARAHFQLAGRHASTAGLRTRIAEHRDAVGWTIQLGAFSSRSNAENAARTASYQTRTAGLTTPLVVPADVSGRQLFLVQVGRYSTYSAALAARTKLSRSDAIVQPLSN